jgi:hypothetical protein
LYRLKNHNELYRFSKKITTVYKAMNISTDIMLCLCRKDPKKRRTGRRGSTPRDISPQIRKVIRDITDMRRNMVTKPITARKPNIKVNIRTTNISNKIKRTTIKFPDFLLCPPPNSELHFKRNIFIKKSTDGQIFDCTWHERNVNAFPCLRSIITY